MVREELEAILVCLEELELELTGVRGGAGPPGLKGKTGVVGV